MDNKDNKNINSAPHQHHHSPEHIKAVSNRLARAIGHLEAIKRMVEEDRDCSEILIQLMAVKSALNNTGKVILREHMEHCITHAVKEGDYEALEEFNIALEQFL
ncbi:MAG: metal-sensing transcriptional repressor [Firmicutes bacterium]|nr:metal-sensing transcriptional repressor [Bacillota bacterium]